MFIINDIFTKKDFLDIIKKENIDINSPSLCSKSNGYDFDRSYYNDINEIVDDAEIIKNYTQFPSINKAIINLNIYLVNNKCKKIDYDNLYDIKQELKKLSINKFNSKPGRYEIIFD